jgi:hypothetical protein
MSLDLMLRRRKGGRERGREGEKEGGKQGRRKERRKEEKEGEGGGKKESSQFNYFNYNYEISQKLLYFSSTNH